MQAKNQLHAPRFSGDIAKICKLFILVILSMPGYAHPKCVKYAHPKISTYLRAKNTYDVHFQGVEVMQKRDVIGRRGVGDSECSGRPILIFLY